MPLDKSPQTLTCHEWTPPKQPHIKSFNFLQLFRCGQRISQWLRGALLLLVLLWLVLSVWQAPVIVLAKSETLELRGVWMTNFGAALMYYTTRLDEVVAHMAKYRLNTLYPVVWNRGYTLYLSAIALSNGGRSRDRLTSLPLLPFGDVLSGLVYQAHRQHLRLIPWFEYGLMMPPQSAIALEHPDWLTTTQSGSKGSGWLNPFPFIFCCRKGRQKCFYQQTTMIITNLSNTP